MAFVRLIFPVDVVISPIDKASTRWNTAAREPVLQVTRASASVTIPAQVVWLSRRNPDVSSRAGVEEKTSGYLVIRVDQATALSYTPQRGDKITTIPGEDGEFYVTQLRPGAHKGGRNRIMNLHFEDRTPVKGG